MNKIKIINNKNQISALCINETVIPGVNNHKPSIAVLNENEMLLFTLHRHYEEDAHGGPSQVCHTVMYHSYDGGITWGKGKHMPFKGFEASASVIDGVIFVQTHLYPDIFDNDFENCIALLYRSDDNGETWTETRFTPEFFGIKSNTVLCMSRNLVKLPDDSIIGFVWSLGEYQYRVKSMDMGKSWNFDIVEDSDIKFKEGAYRPVMAEAVTFVTPSKRLMAVSRVILSNLSDKNIPYLYNAKPFDTDEGDGMILIESNDFGLTWHAVRGLGYGGMMYPSIVYLDEKRFILTYTLRNATASVGAPYRHVGMQAVMGIEEDDGSFSVDFDNDVIILDDKTPGEVITSEGYGMTNAVSEGILITPCCYAVAKDEYKSMVQSGECFDSADVFNYLFTETGKADAYDGPDVEWWNKSTPEWKKVLIHECAWQVGLIHYKSRVIKWRVEKHEK